MRAEKFLAVVVLWGLFAVSCGQYDIFNKISNETKPLKPRIQGGPTNMVVFSREVPGRGSVPVMYVASGRLHWYANGAGGPQWDSYEYLIPQPGGKISALAVTRHAGTERLYALCHDGKGVSTRLQYIESNGYNWIPVGNEAAINYPVIQTIYADPQSEQLFAGGSINAFRYAILYMDNNSKTLKILKNNASLLSGAVSRKEGGDDVYYLSTRKISPDELSTEGIFKIAKADLAGTEPTFLQTGRFMGLIKLDDKDNTIIAVERGKDAEVIKVERGKLYKVNNNSDGFELMQYNNGGGDVAIGYYATGALALWEKSDPVSKLATEKRLVAGIQFSTTSTSSYTNGYVEFRLNSDIENDPNSDPPYKKSDSYGSFDTDSARFDAGNLQSADPDGNRQYTSSLGQLIINHLFQVPQAIDPNMTFFASTHKDGLWSYRFRSNNGGWQWNAEE
jgi:hypothetical protein